MRTIIELPDAQIKALREIEERHNISRAHLIRQAVAKYVVENTVAPNAFGAWKKSPNAAPVDSVALQQALRDEWER
jgi:predicted transcriptional regulator